MRGSLTPVTRLWFFSKENWDLELFIHKKGRNTKYFGKLIKFTLEEEYLRGWEMLHYFNTVALRKWFENF